MSTFNDIPFEVFITVIVPLLQPVDVGRLSQVSTMWKKFADDPMVWKYLYLQLTPSKILDTSVHIGPKYAWVSYRRDLQFIPFKPEYTERYKNSDYFLNRTVCCECIPQDLKSSLKSWQEVRNDGVLTDEFPIIPPPADYPWRVRYGTGIYCDYVNTEWRDYNHRRGLSTINLCQNPNHYDISTLGTLEDCKTKKSFKKWTLKVLLKKPKAEIAKATREKKAKLKKLEKARETMRQLKIQCLEAEIQYFEAEEAEEKATKIFNDISTSIKLA